MMNADGRPAATEMADEHGNKFMRMEPIDAAGVKLMSMGFFIEQGQSVVWRGPMLHKALTQFLKDTAWGELDYLLIDLPPGTGDAQLSISQLAPITGGIIVTTPQDVSLADCRRANSMFKQTNIPVLGVVENMSYFVNRHGERENKNNIPTGLISQWIMSPASSKTHAISPRKCGMAYVHDKTQPRPLCRTPIWQPCTKAAAHRLKLAGSLSSSRFGKTIN
jgi:Mrp family chromosome partitioning ATPase